MAERHKSKLKSAGWVSHLHSEKQDASNIYLASLSYSALPPFCPPLERWMKATTLTAPATSSLAMKHRFVLTACVANIEGVQTANGRVAHRTFKLIEICRH